MVPLISVILATVVNLGATVITVIGLRAVNKSRQALVTLAASASAEIDARVAEAEASFTQHLGQSRQAVVNALSSSREAGLHATKAETHAATAEHAAVSSESHSQAAASYEAKAETHAGRSEAHADRSVQHAVIAFNHSGLVVDSAQKAAASCQTAKVCGRCESLVARYRIIGGKPICANCKPLTA